MQVRFLLGPAGSGKTSRCLAEIGEALVAQPAGPPLVLLAPKQATFQLERQLLAHPGLAGYTRLRILSFERLARFILESLNSFPPESLGEAGRVMVLRALLIKHEGELQAFRRSARRPGFATQLSQVLQELQQHQIHPDQLRALTHKSGWSDDLHAKLYDLEQLARAYAAWLESNQLEDGNRLLSFATNALRSAAASGKSPLDIAALWLDGFAEMTPQEMDLLAAVLPHAKQATLAFCLDPEVAAQPSGPSSWLSIWGAVSKTFRQCRERIRALPDVEVVQDAIRRGDQPGRFAQSPALAHLESRWAQPAGFAGPPESVQLFACADPEAEAQLAAREILRFVRAGHRYRDIAVLVRDLTDYHRPLERTFRRYGIPCFLDRRESVAHHPLAELTRSALRTVAFEWRHEDWFAALKSGFGEADETLLDRLENEALARGWQGSVWHQPLPARTSSNEPDWEQLRQRLLPPFLQLAHAINSSEPANGKLLAAAIRAFWAALKVEATLTRWSEVASRSTVHGTVLDQMQSWLDNLALAFPNTALALRDWLPILEAGLANLTVGVIPPALDQVLIGAIDRSRNPDLKFTLLLGLNAGVFPAPPATRTLLTESDRIDLAGNGAQLGLNLRDQLARERYYGYIACTRARQRLLTSYALADVQGRPLNPSPLVTHLQELFPALVVQPYDATPVPEQAEHLNELIPALLRGEVVAPALAATAGPVLDHWAHWSALPGPEALQLSPTAAAALFGNELPTSVSALETFAACPFRFFAGYALGADERQLFETDPRQTGSFQHELLAEFHRELQREGKRWRDLTPAAARDRVAALGARISPDIGGGRFAADGRSRFLAATLTSRIQEVVAVMVGWMRQYEFDPAEVELGFGLPDSPLPAWRLPLANHHTLALRGKIDRVDLCLRPDGRAVAVVLDYKSSRRKLDPTLLHHGLQLQLLSYLGVLRRVEALPAHFTIREIIPSGVFFVPLRAAPTSGERMDILEPADDDSTAFQHSGRFDRDALPQLDNRGATRGVQFKYRLNKDGALSKAGNDALPPTEFAALLEKIEADLRRHGESIFAGTAAAKPYRKGQDIACTHCEFKSVCRFDGWLHAFNVLTPPPAPVAPPQPAAKRPRK